MRYRIYRLFARLLKACGPVALRRMAEALAFCCWTLLPARRKEATAAVGKHLRLGPEEARRIARRSFTENFRSFFEIFHMDAFHTSTAVGELHSPESLAALREETAPIVVATAHLGSWELMPGLASALVPGREGMVVVRRQGDPDLTRLMAELRGARGMRAVDHRRASDVVLPSLRRGGATAFLVDHNCSRKEAVFLPFMEDEAAVNAGPAMLALRAKAAVYPVFLLRSGDGKHILHILDPLRTADLQGTIAEKVEQIARFYTDAVAEMVRRYPEQWFWMHKRWKTRRKKG